MTIRKWLNVKCDSEGDARLLRKELESIVGARSHFFTDRFGEMVATTVSKPTVNRVIDSLGIIAAIEMDEEEPVLPPGTRGA